MRYLDQSTNDSVAVTVRTDAVDCPELRPSNERLECQCWIAVHSGQGITVLVDLELSTSQFQVDLVVDGIVRNMHVSTVTPKNEGRQILFEFYKGIYKNHRSYYLTEMKSSRLLTENSNVQYVDSDQTSVGSIEIHVYKYYEGHNHVRKATLPDHVDDWEQLGYSPGTAGIHPTHETVLEFSEDTRLNDTGRRTWRNKSKKLPMGKVPLVSFKYLYRHENALRDAGIVDPHLNVLASADAVSAMAAGLLQMAEGSSPHAEQPRHAIVSPDSSTTVSMLGTTTTASQAARASNPFAMTEKNGIRILKQLTITPETPGPQINNALRYHVTNGGKKRKKRAKSRVSTAVDDDTDSDDEDVPSEESTPDPESNKRRKAAEVENLRAKISKMQADLDQLKRFEDEEKGKTESMDMELEEQHSTLEVQKAAIEHQLQQRKVQIQRYKKRQAELKEGPQEHKTAHGHPAVRDESTSSDNHLDGPVTPIGPTLVVRKNNRRSNGRNRKDNNEVMDGGFVVVDSDAMEGDTNTSDKVVSNTVGDKKMAIGHVITP